MRDYSKITMVNVQKKSIMDYIYSEMAQRFMFVVFLASTFVFGLMYGYGEIESPKVFWLMALMLIYYIFDPNLKSNPIDLPFLFLCAVTYLIAVWQKMDNPVVNDIYDPTPYAWIMPSVYLLGNLVVGNKKEKLEDRVLLVLMILGIGMYIQGILNYYGVYYFEPMALQLDRIWRSFWNPNFDGTRNNWNNGFIIIASALFYSLLMREKRRVFARLVFLMIIFSVITNLYFGGRTLIVITVLVFVVVSIIYVGCDLKNRFDNNKRIILSVFGGVAFFTLIFSVMYLNNILGIADIYNNIQFFSKDGGIIRNVRLQLWYGGVKNAINHQYGGWNMGDTYILQTTHNTWIEYARYYDVVIFSLWIAFLVTVLIKHIKCVRLAGRQYYIIFFAVSAELMMFIYSMIEPIYSINTDLLLFYVFVQGVTSGICRVLQSEEYNLGYLESDYITSNKIFIVGFGLLTFAFMADAYQDWWSNRFKLLSISLPIIGYVLGGVVGNKKYKKTFLILISFICLFFATYCWIISVRTGYYAIGFCVEPITGNIVEKNVLFAIFVMPISICIGLLFYLLRVKKIISTIFSIMSVSVIMAHKMGDGRLNTIKEAIRLQMGMENGIQWIASKDNTMGLISSHSMWLDYARDYGMLTLGILCVFEGWSLYCFVKFILKNVSCVEDYVLLEAFILFNFHFAFEASAMSNVYIFALGLVVYGMIVVSISMSKMENKNCEKRIITSE